MVIVIIGVLLTVVGCSKPGASNELASSPAKAEIKIQPIDLAKLVPATAVDPKAKQEYDRRVVYKKKTLEAARTIAVKAQDPEITTVYNYLVEHSAIAIPGRGGWLQMEDPFIKSPMFCLVVYLTGDEKLGAPWDKFDKKVKAGATFDPTSLLMVIQPADAPNSETLGITLLHESFHAYSSLTTGARPNDAESFCAGEIGAHEFERRVIQAIHPTTYDKVVEETVQMLERMGQDRSVTFYSVKRFVDDNVDRAFERKVQPGTEHGGLWIQIFYDANFRAIERHWPKDKWVEKKIAFLKDWLERGGQAQWPH